jgi:hypothetical protein
MRLFLQVTPISNTTFTPRRPSYDINCSIRLFRQPIDLKCSASSAFAWSSESSSHYSPPFWFAQPRHTAAAMDIALELLDTYALDWIYSAILPAQPAPYNLKDGISNSTSADIQSASPWQYKPSSNIISFTPTEAAYTSQWTRDNVYRQTLSLFFITW